MTRALQRHAIRSIPHIATACDSLVRKASASAPTSDPVQGFRAQRSRVSGIKGGLQGSESNGSVYGPLDPNPYTLIEPLYYPDSTFPRPSHPDLLNAACLSSF